MLRYSSLHNKLTAIHPDLSAPVTTHLQKVLNSILLRANELASHAGRKVVHPHDVAQASIPFCITCEDFDSTTNTCRVLPSQTAGGLPTYDGFCGGHGGQCGITRNATCVFSGGRTRKARWAQRARKGKKKKHRSLNTASQKQKVGGTFDYKGFCGDHLSQCAWADSLSGNASSQCGSGHSQKKSKHKRQTRKSQKKGGVFDYTGFCGDHTSQCAWADSLSGNTSSNCKGGRKRSSRYSLRHSRKTRGGADGSLDESLYDSLEGSTNESSSNDTPLLNTRVIHQHAIRQHMMDTYGMRWTASALRLLHQTCQFHLDEVVSKTQQNELYARDNVHGAVNAVSQDYIV